MLPGLFVRVATVAGGPPVVGVCAVGPPADVRNSGAGGAAGKGCAPVAGGASKNDPRAARAPVHRGLPGGMLALRAAAAASASCGVGYSSDDTDAKLYGLPICTCMPGSLTPTVEPAPAAC